MNVIVLEQLTFRPVATFVHPLQAAAVLPALARAVGGSVFLYAEGDVSLGLTKAEIPRRCEFGFAYRDERDAEGTYGIVCRP